MADDAPLTWLAAQTERLRRRYREHPVAMDVLLAALILAASFVSLSHQDRLGSQTIAFGVLLCAPLPLRRASPELTFAGLVGIGFLQWLISPPQPADVALLLALFYVAERSRASVVAGALAIVEAGAIAATLKWTVVESLKVWVGLSALTAAAAGAGIVMRQRRELLDSLHERASRLERERDQQAELAVAAERARIAREMHDIVSHNLTVMIALADGAGYAMNSSPDEVGPAIERISATGRQALGEMRRLLGVLRDEPRAETFEPQPSLARLDELIGQVEAAGIPVAVSIDGDPRELSEGVQLTLFRVAQEALTNTLKHAVAPTCATLTLGCGADGAVALEVADDGRSLAPVASLAKGSETAGSAVAGSGRGLAGMRERAAAYNGRLQAGPASDGGWRVRLELDA